MSKLKDKVAVVTGASKGIGAGIARALGAEGASVIVNYASDRKGADRVVADIVKSGGKAVAVQGDVSKAEDVRRVFAETKKAFGHVDVLVNNAAIYQFAPIDQITEEHFDRQFDINVKGLLFATQEAVKLFNGDGAASSTSVHSRARGQFREVPFTRPPRRPSIPLLASWPGNWELGKSE